MWLEAIHKSEGHSEECPTCGSSVRRRIYGEMYAGSFIQDGQRVEIRRVPNEGYADPIYLDPLTQYFDGGLYRIWPSDNYYSRGGKKLHRDAWIKAFGPIPKGCHIHHKDGNTGNNALSNLECLDAKEHLSLAWQDHGAKRTKHFTEDARSKAAEWHGSEAGRLWHSRHAERVKSWTKWKREDLPCQYCRAVFSCLVRKSGNTQKYCSDKCKVAAYRARGAGAEASARYRERQKAK